MLQPKSALLGTGSQSSSSAVPSVCRAGRTPGWRGGRCHSGSFRQVRCFPHDPETQRHRRPLATAPVKAGGTATPQTHREPCTGPQEKTPRGAGAAGLKIRTEACCKSTVSEGHRQQGTKAGELHWLLWVLQRGDVNKTHCTGIPEHLPTIRGHHGTHSFHKHL
jgi:hypothetical protein